MSLLSAILSAAVGLFTQSDAPPSAVASRPHFNEVSPLQPLIDGAEDGATVRVAPGVYRGFLRIHKRVALMADGECVLDGCGFGDILEISAEGAAVEGFALRNTGADLDREHCAIRVLAPRVRIERNTLEDVLFGIDLRLAPQSIVRDNRIGGKALDQARRGDGLRVWKSDEALIERNVVHDGRDSVLWYSRGIVLRGNVGLRCRYGLHLMFSNDVRIEGNELQGNSVGIYLMYSSGIELRGNRIECNRGPSGYGIGLKEVDEYRIEGNLIAGNCAGIYMDDSPFHDKGLARVEGNTIAQNTVGLSLLPNVRGNQIVGNSFIDNIEQVRVLGRGTIDGNAFSINGSGNFWTDYVGYDLDGDGVGEFAHEPTGLYEHLMDREPKLRVFQFSPAQEAVEFMARAVPAVRPQPKFADDYPLTSPSKSAELALEAVPARGGAESTHVVADKPALAGTATLLLGLAVGVVFVAFRGTGGLS